MEREDETAIHGSDQVTQEIRFEQTEEATIHGSEQAIQSNHIDNDHEQAEQTIIYDQPEIEGQKEPEAASCENEFDVFGQLVSSDLTTIANTDIWAARNLKMKLQMVLANGYMEWVQQNGNLRSQIVSPQPQILLQTMPPPIIQTMLPPTVQQFESDKDDNSEDGLDYAVYGEDGERFDVRKHRFMAILLIEDKAIASLSFHKKVAEKLGLDVDDNVHELGIDGVPVKPK